MPWFIRSAFAAIGKTIRQQRIIKELDSLSDRELKDMGISRGEIPFIVADAIRKSL